jgi:flagellar biosynthesis/type III secretory pathway M-ring protein FliF/YscJ
MLGVRPALKLVADGSGGQADALPDPNGLTDLGSPEEMSFAPMLGDDSDMGGLDQLSEEPESPQERLKQLMEEDEKQAIMVLKRWTQAPAT